MSYKVELIPSGLPGARPTMFRGGLKFEANEPRILELTKEQAEVFKNDWRFKISASKDSGETVEDAQAATREEPTPSIVGGTQETITSEVEAPTASFVASEETPSGETEDVKNLLKEHSREELDIMAGELGLDGPFGNKTEVAQAILAAR